MARQLPRAGQARRHLPRLPAQDQQPGLAEPDVRDRVHRAHPRPVRDRGPRPRRRASGASGRACRPRSRSSSRSASCVVVLLAIGAADDAQLRPADHRRACRSRTGSSSSTTGSRRASSRPSALQRPAAARCSSPALIWTTEAMRLYLVVEALGLPRRPPRDQRRVLRRADRRRCSPPCRSRRPGSASSRRGVVGVLTARLRRAARPRRSRSRSSTGRSACSRSSSSARSRTRSRRSAAARASTALPTERRRPDGSGASRDARRCTASRRSGAVGDASDPGARAAERIVRVAPVIRVHRRRTARCRTAPARVRPDRRDLTDRCRAPSGEPAPVPTGDTGDGRSRPDSAGHRGTRLAPATHGAT